MKSLSGAMAKLAQKNPTAQGIVGGVTEIQRPQPDYAHNPTPDPGIDPHSDFEGLRVRVVAPKGTELVPDHPARIRE